MKKLLLSALVILGFTAVSFGQAAVTKTASVSASVLTAIDMTKNLDLQFGSFAHGVGGTVTIAANSAGDRTASGPILYNSGTTQVSSAKFTVTGDANHSFTIGLPADNTKSITTGGESPSTMALNFTSSPAAGTATLDGSGNSIIYVGAVLQVAATQAAGAYTGTFDVTVNYN